jgi:NADH dehydrogenase
MNKEDSPARATQSHLQHIMARRCANIVRVLNFLGLVAWPIIDFIFRFIMANQLLTAGMLMAYDWNTSVLLATQEYPVPWLNPHLAAFLGILAEIGGGLSLLLGLFTRLGALAVLILGLAAQLYYVTLDVNLFWIVLMAGYVLRGPGPISLDHLLKHGLNRSPIPFATVITNFFDATRSSFSGVYLLSLRIWLALTFLIVSYKDFIPLHQIHFFESWLPIQSAKFIFPHLAILISVLFFLGFSTRLLSLFVFILICIVCKQIITVVNPVYWMMAMGIFFGFGPGPFSIDYLILRFLKRRYPQFSGKPAFSLENLPHVVIVGAGFGGITCAKALRDIPVRISLIDRRNYHLFQPLLYQVATGGLSPADIAVPIRAIFTKQFNVEVLLGEVNAIDKENRILHTQNLQIPYDYLVIATGATHSYFGKDHWAPFAPGLKQIEDAISVRSKLVETFELAEIATDENERKHLLTFVIIGGGPTGVELAGAIAELSRYGMEKNYRHFDPASAEIILIQAPSRIIPTFSDVISKSAQQSLEKMGVKILLNSRVEQVDEDGVIVNGQKIYTRSVLWAAGVTASPAAKWLDVDADQAGRVKVKQDLSIPNYPNIFVIGDTALTISWNGKPAPGIAEAAKQAGKHVAKIISQIIYNEPLSKEFNYQHFGMLATIGRKSAVAEFNYIKLKGATAWWFWIFAHVCFLVGARNRSSVILNWAWSYFTYRANNLLITQKFFELRKTFQEKK